MATTFTFDQFAEELRKDAELAKEAVKVVRTAVKLHGPMVVQAEIASVARAPVDRGTYKNSFRFEDIPDGAVAYNFQMYAPIIEYGRRPGARMPPVQAIYEWVRRKQIGTEFTGPIQAAAAYGPVRRETLVEDARLAALGHGTKKIRVSRPRGPSRGALVKDAVFKQQWGIALAIARKIKAHGLPAHLILESAAAKIDRAIVEEIDMLLEKHGGA